MALVRVKEKYQVTIPNDVRELAGLAIGDYLEAKLGPRGVIMLTPKTLIDRKLAESFEDVKTGRTHGPFDTASAMATSIEANIKKSRLIKQRKRS